MKKILFSASALLFGSLALAHGVHAGKAVARPTEQVQGGVFLSLQNTEATADTLISAQADRQLVEHVELHTHINDNGVMRMRPVEGGIELPAKQTVELKPGGYHIMLIGLKKPLKTGDTFPLTLNFKNSKSQTLTVTVGAMQADHGHHHGHGHHHHHSH